MLHHSFQKKVHFVMQEVPNIRVINILHQNLFLLQTNLHFNRHCVTSKAEPAAAMEQLMVVLHNCRRIVRVANFKPELMLRLVVML